MSPLFRSEPRRSLTAWLLILLCGLSLVATTGGAPADQYLVRRAEITLSVADAERTVTALEELARTVRGRFAGSGILVFRASGGQRRIEATLELPPEMLETALARLRGMSLVVLGEKVENRDVSSQVVELNRKLEQLRATRRRLSNLMERATTDAERRQVQTALSQVEAEIVEAEAALATLRQEADWAVIRILAHEAPPTPTPSPPPTPSLTPTATSIPVTPSPTPWHPGETVKRATSVLVFIVQGLTDVLIVVTIVGGPFLVVVLVGRWIRGKVRS
jgi:hypothetical protein